MKTLSTRLFARIAIAAFFCTMLFGTGVAFADEQVTATGLPTTDAIAVQQDEEPLLAAGTLETVDMHRLYNPNSGEHFYTGSWE